MDLARLGNILDIQPKYWSEDDTLFIRTAIANLTSMVAVVSDRKQAQEFYDTAPSFIGKVYHCNITKKLIKVIKLNKKHTNELTCLVIWNGKLYKEYIHFKSNLLSEEVDKSRFDRKINKLLKLELK